LLEIEELNASYGNVSVVHGVSLVVDDEETVTIIGSNGAGKSSVLRSISGMIRHSSKRMIFNGTRLDGLQPNEIVRKGVAYVPEGRGIFPRMTTIENLLVGAYADKDKKSRAASLSDVFRMFPRLDERRKQLAGTLSGGEQQMLAIARGLMSKPKLLMLDEPSLGLAPNIVQELYKTVKVIHEQEGMSILLVEQNINYALAVSKRGYVMEDGKITMEGESKDLIKNDFVRKAYMGM